MRSLQRELATALFVLVFLAFFLLLCGAVLGSVGPVEITVLIVLALIGVIGVRRRFDTSRGVQG